MIPRESLTVWGFSFLFLAIPHHRLAVCLHKTKAINRIGKRYFIGDHSVPENWVQHSVINTEEGSNPGAPLAWGSPEDPDDAVAGYGYVAADTSEVEETFYYHSDHLGSTAYITDQQANVTQYDAYLPYGELLVDEHSSSADLPYKFNGKELDEETGLYYYGARYMNPLTSMWYGVDPLTEQYVNIGAYIYCHGNPIRLIDPDGQGDYYMKNGTWLGRDKNKDDYAYTVDWVHLDEHGFVDNSTNARLLPITNSKLLKDASTAYGESSGNPMETYAIAYVHKRNRVAYGEGSNKANHFLRTSNEGRNDENAMVYAIGGVINAYTGGYDYSNGATMWDGAEQAEYPAEFTDFKTPYECRNGKKITIELHKNTMGWSISDNDYEKWKKNVGSKFKAPQVSYTSKTRTFKGNKYYTHNAIKLVSTAVYGKTIFWKELRGNKVLHGKD